MPSGCVFLIPRPNTNILIFNNLTSYLEANVLYNVSVLAYTTTTGNLNGPVNLTLVRTLESTPDGTVQLISFTVSSSTISFSWKAPDIKRRNGVIVGYTITWSRINTTFVNPALYASTLNVVVYRPVDGSTTYGDTSAFSTYQISGTLSCPFLSRICRDLLFF